MNEEGTLIARLVAMQHTLRAVVESCNIAAASCDADGQKGLAAATYMVAEAIEVWADAIRSYVMKGVSSDACDDEF